MISKIVFMFIVIILTLCPSCISKKNNIEMNINREVLSTVHVNSNYITSLYMDKIKNESIVFAMSNDYPYCTWDYALINLDNTILLKRYDYTSNKIAYRNIEKRKFDNLVLRIQWIIGTNNYIEADVDSDGIDTDYGIFYRIIYHHMDKNYAAIIYNESNSKEYGKLHDEFINAMKGLILEGEICPGLYYKEVTFLEELNILK